MYQSNNLSFRKYQLYQEKAFIWFLLTATFTFDLQKQMRSSLSLKYFHGAFEIVC